MEALLETLITQLQRLSAPKLQVVAQFVEFLSWQEETQTTAVQAESKLLESPNDSEFEALVDQLVDELANLLGGNVPMLSDYAVSRAGIYEESL